jgi:galactose oxidase
MANLGNTWHIPASPELLGRGGMRDPAGALVADTAITIFSGNQFQGGGNPGNQQQTGSTLFFKKSVETTWKSLPLVFQNAAGNNKYYAATIDRTTYASGDVAQYYLRIAYDDHDTTFVHVQDGVSATTADEGVARANPFTFKIESRGQKGQWGPIFQLPNVAIHTHVLPNGLVLMWGRRNNPTDSLDVHECSPFLWNPTNGIITGTPQPALANGTKVNLFCSGHAFLPDGRLLVVGGHRADSDGLSQAVLYDSTADSWVPTAPMTTPLGEEVRRWYPTATALPDGRVLVSSGSYIDPSRPPGLRTIVVDLLQVWDNGSWKAIKKQNGDPLNFIGLPLYPRMHVASDGRVFMSGPNDRTLSLKTSDPGQWTEIAFRNLGNRDYCPSVMYDVDKVIFIGGGNDANTHTPTADVEIIDLGETSPKWRKTNRMNFPRRQHNATVLPDGTVLVTGGTRGGGGPNNGFNDLGPGQPVHVAELWDPGTRNWTELTAESVDRCYHATMALLPDGTVLSAGGGEYRADNVHDNDPKDSHRQAQIFFPPYLFKGPRPTVTAAPASVNHGETFEVSTPQPDDVGRVSWVRLPSVTHSFDENQRINFLEFEQRPGALAVKTPDSANVCPPGHYMMFALSKAGVPSLAKIIQVKASVAPVAIVAGPTAAAEPAMASAATMASVSGPGSKQATYLRVYTREAEVAERAKGMAVVLGITGTCPYGIGSCWGGAYEALRRLKGVDMVSPVPNVDNSTAEVFLEDDRLPELDVWDEEFKKIVNGTYELRGVEVTLRGPIQERDGILFLAPAGRRLGVALAPLMPDDKIQWNHSDLRRRPLEADEPIAYQRLAAAFGEAQSHPQVTVTGPLKLAREGYRLHVRLFGHG